MELALLLRGSRTVVLGARSLEQHQHPLAACEKCKFSALPPTQKTRVGAPSLCGSDPPWLETRCSWHQEACLAPPAHDRGHRGPLRTAGQDGVSPHPGFGLPGPPRNHEHVVSPVTGDPRVSKLHLLARLCLLLAFPGRWLQGSHGTRDCHGLHQVRPRQVP